MAQLLHCHSIMPHRIWASQCASDTMASEVGGGGWGGGVGGDARLVETGGYLEHVSILESSATSCLHPHLRLLALPIVWTVVQVLGLDEIQALSNLGRLKLDKMQVACGRCTHLFAGWLETCEDSGVIMMHLNAQAW